MPHVCARSDVLCARGDRAHILDDALLLSEGPAARVGVLERAAPLVALELGHKVVSALESVLVAAEAPRCEEAKSTEKT